MKPKPRPKPAPAVNGARKRGGEITVDGTTYTVGSPELRDAAETWALAQLETGADLRNRDVADRYNAAINWGQARAKAARDRYAAAREPAHA